MDLDIQLQVTDQELKEFPQENTTNSTTNRWDTHSPTRQLLVLRKETLIQPSEPLVHGKETFIQSSEALILEKGDIHPVRCPGYSVSDLTEKVTHSA